MNVRNPTKTVSVERGLAQTSGDTEVIVHLYEDHGDDCVQFLRGMFAFALWDRNEQRLLVARDRVGKKPLFYAERDGCLWFASEPKSIFQDRRVRREMDLESIDSFLQFGYVPDPSSAFSGLSKLAPGHLLVWSGGRVETRRYWKLEFQPKLELEESDLQELIRTELINATRIRLRSDVPLGALLSGGVDSSAVVAAMAHASSAPIKTFSIGFGDREFDESGHAREIAKLFGTDHHELMVEPHAIEILTRLIWHYGEPFADHSAIPSFYLAEMAREHVTVALNGDGGDEAFAGYRRYLGATAGARLSPFPRPAADMVARTLDRVGTGAREDSVRARAGRVARGLARPAESAYASWVANFTPAERSRLYAPEVAASIDLNAADTVCSEPYLSSDGPELLDRLLDVDINTYLPGDLLVKMDIATMAHSLEVRSPFLDHEFMEMAAKIPAQAKLGGKTTKRILKDAVRTWIPDHILDRPKQGFTVPMREWLRSDLRCLPSTILLDPRCVERGLFRKREIQRLIDDHQNAKRDNTEKLWSLIQLELWLQTYIDRHPSGPISTPTG